MNKLSVLILSTLPDIGIKSLGTKSLIKIQSKYFIDYQLETLTKALKNIDHEIIIASHFDYQKTYKTLNKYKKYNIRILKQGFENINYGGAMIDGLDKTTHDNTLCINYGCWFNKDTIKAVIGNQKDNNLGIIKNKHLDNLPISCLIKDHNIENLFFDIGEYRYAEMCFINGPTKKFILDNLSIQNNINRFSFEIFNIIIERGILFKPVMLDNKNFLFLTNNKHFNKFRKLINESISKTK